MKTEYFYKLSYTKLDGSRASKMFDTKEQTVAAIQRAKTQQPQHNFSEEITEFEREQPKPITFKERASHYGQEAYTRRVRGY